MDLRQRNARLAAELDRLPGAAAYVNRRRMSVGGAFDGLTLEAFLRARHPHIDAEVWEASMRAGALEIDGRRVVSMQRRVRAGNQLVHVIEDEVEPDVSAALRILHEDEALLVLDKPAPLPVHPSGRFNKNTVLGLLAHVFCDLRVHPVHRLDADTTGVLVMAKDPAAARSLGEQFEARTVGKRYLARVLGAPPRRFDVDRPVTRGPDTRGKRVAGSGAPALTRFWALRAGPTSLLAAWPRSGRTNQIRVHLASAGHPIVGDDAYGPDASDDFTSGAPLCLHADAIRLRHPSDGRWIRFIARRPAWTRPDYGGLGGTGTGRSIHAGS